MPEFARRDVSRDWLVAGGAAVLVLVATVAAPDPRPGPDQRGFLLGLVGAAALVVQRRFPVPVLGLATGCMLVYQLRGYSGVVAVLPLLFALYAAAQAGHRWPLVAALAAVVAGERFLVDVPQPVGETLPRSMLLLGWMVAASVAGALARQRRAYLEQVERRAAEAERTREETARRRADEERLRIARELHDSLTHSISIIKVQAGIAVHLARKRDEPVPEALLAIQQASAEATRELRATLEVLRSDQAQHGSGLDRLDTLVDGARRAGLPVMVRVSGEPRTLPAPVDRAAYRIIQEALTNVSRHAGPATATVRLDYQTGALTVRVEDDGVGAAGSNGGRDRGSLSVLPGVGLVGMRERVSALGGTLDAGPRPEGGFQVRADLPLAVET